MSHGCDSSDFESVLGPMPREGAGVTAPVLFLLQDPGADYGNGAPVAFAGFRKQPPVHHYYWTPNGNVWPQGLADFNGNFYGPYFAYLMRRHQLLNVYITNVAKCKLVGDNDRARVAEHCAERYLTREMALFAPRVTFCFGRAAQRQFGKFIAKTKLACPSVYLRHPSYIAARWQTSGRSQKQLVGENDHTVTDALAQFL